MPGGYCTGQLSSRTYNQAFFRFLHYSELEAKQNLKEREKKFERRVERMNFKKTLSFLCMCSVCVQLAKFS